MLLFDNDGENRNVHRLIRRARAKVQNNVDDAPGTTAKDDVKYDELSSALESVISQLTRIASTQVVSKSSKVRPAVRAQNVLGSVVSDSKRAQRLLSKSDFRDFSAGEVEALQKYYDTINDTMTSGIMTPEVLDFIWDNGPVKEMVDLFALKLVQYG